MHFKIRFLILFFVFIYNNLIYSKTKYYLNVGYNDLMLKKGRESNNNIEYLRVKNKNGIQFGVEQINKINKGFEYTIATELIYYNNTYKYTSSINVYNVNERGFFSNINSGINLKIKKFKIGTGISIFTPLLYFNNSEQISNQIGLMHNKSTQIKFISILSFLKISFKISQNLMLTYCYSSGLNPSVNLKLNTNSNDVYTKYYLEAQTFSLNYKLK